MDDNLRSRLGCIDIPQWTAASGWARDSDDNSSPYVRLGLMQKL
jgi:hypothetical protein